MSQAALISNGSARRQAAGSSFAGGGAAAGGWRLNRRDAAGDCSVQFARPNLRSGKARHGRRRARAARLERPPCC